MSNKRHYAALALLLALGACGGSGNDNDGNGNGGGQAGNQGASDAFFARVLALVGASPDNTEPENIDSIAVTAPETIEPAPL